MHQSPWMLPNAALCPSFSSTCRRLTEKGLTVLGIAISFPEPPPNPPLGAGGSAHSKTASTHRCGSSFCILHTHPRACAVRNAQHREALFAYGVHARESGIPACPMPHRKTSPGHRAAPRLSGIRGRRPRQSHPQTAPMPHTVQGTQGAVLSALPPRKGQGARLPFELILRRWRR